jgi:hypothetical protein
MYGSIYYDKICAGFDVTQPYNPEDCNLHDKILVNKSSVKKRQIFLAVSYREGLTFVDRFTATGAQPAARRIQILPMNLCKMADNLWNEGKLLTLRTA